MRFIQLKGGGVAEIHTGDYGCCADCKAALEADDAANGPAVRLASKGMLAGVR